jgi:hypothetical protein
MPTSVKTLLQSSIAQGPVGPQGVQGIAGSSGATSLAGTADTQILYNSGGQIAGDGELAYVPSRNEFRYNNSVIRHNQLGSGSGTRTIDLSQGNFISARATGACTWVVTNTSSTANFVNIFALRLQNGGIATQTWMSGIKWPNGTAPSLTASGIDLLVFISDDNGVTWRGLVSMFNSL